MFCALFVFYFYYYVGLLRSISFLLLLLRWCFTHYLFSTLTMTLVCCAPFVFYFNYYVGVLPLFVFCLYYYVGVLRTICFLFSLIRWCFVHYLFSTLSISWVLRTNCFLLSLLRWYFAHYLFSTLTISLVCYALFVFYSNYYVGLLRTICFLL